MVSPRIVSVRLFPLMAPLTQNGLLSFEMSGKWMRDYQKTGNLEELISRIQELEVPEMYVNLKQFVIKKIEEETRWRR